MSSDGRYKALKGMKDILPPDIHVWQKVEAAAREVFGRYGVQEIRTPVAEATELFIRSIGESTDIIEKEMYVFSDKAGRSISLRPEGTASVVRAFVENRLFNQPAPQKFYYAGPMFRYERPQSGRYRQFYQIGVEVFGSSLPETDAEVIAMLSRLLAAIGLPSLAVQINSIGCEQCRPAFKERLRDFLGKKQEGLCADCKRRYDQNPLRILDCKVAGCITLRQGAPRITEHLCADCSGHFARLQTLLSGMGLPFSINPEMVRGLDYYTRTTFEVTSGALGAQNAVAAGGRYDRLVKEFGGPDTPAVGFAMGMERVVELLKQAGGHEAPAPDIFIVALGSKVADSCFFLAHRLREEGLWVELGEHTASLKSQMRRADRLSARYVFILGDEELSAGRLTWKRLSDSSQGEISLERVLENIGLLPGLTQQR